MENLNLLVRGVKEANVLHVMGEMNVQNVMEKVILMSKLQQYLNI